MKKEIRIVDKERGICQVTTTDSRWYDRVEKSPITGLDTVAFRPSVTWIVDYYPKGEGFERFLKKNGEESDQIARIAADRGYKVHLGIAAMNDGGTVKMDDKFTNPTTKEQEELTVEEYAGLMSYAEWWKEEGAAQFEILAFEYTVWPDAPVLSLATKLPAEVFEFAGTVDLKVKRKSDGAIGIIDIKTSLNVYPGHELQVSAYRKAEGADWGAILQVNYTRNKTKKWKFTEVPDQFPLFIATRQIWAHETEGTAPLQRDFPLSLSLNLPKKGTPQPPAEKLEPEPEPKPAEGSKVAKPKHNQHA